MQLSLIPNDKLITIHCSKDDTQLRKWEFTLYANDVVVMPDGDVSLVCENGAIVDGVIENNKVIFDCTSELSKQSGIYKCKLKMVKSDEILYSSFFNLYCEVKP